ncbi:hypothetical protein NUW54_g8609 [Trametes sanguinea]|uniref:Uncharacterized protein n=1 Tax=Trametes sanguinea TaxID=158606 RepID=A0ACC1PC75_9APHY|nr:hypothetical protein NUW54_g8609 [Trametes sanguinea]
MTAAVPIAHTSSNADHLDLYLTVNSPVPKNSMRSPFCAASLHLLHRHRALRDDQLVSKLGHTDLARRMLPGEREHGVARDAREDDAIQWRRHKLDG